MHSDNPNELKITLLQTNPTWLDVEANIRTAEALIEKHTGSHLYVLPEMWATGFSTREAHPAPEAYKWMTDLAKRRQIAIAGSLPIEEGGHTYNRFYFITPQSETHYDKRHLFSYGGETKHFSPGHERIITNYRGFRILLTTCYDLRFPVFLRNRNDYDLLLHVACWPDIRQNAYKILLAARAIENLCYVVSVNRTGKEVFTNYIGGSCIIGPDGSDLAMCKDKEEVSTETLSIEKLHVFRHRYPFLQDADNFSIHEG